METPVAHTAAKSHPTARQLAVTLAGAAPFWHELIAWLETRGIACNQWHMPSPRSGWSLLPVRGKRRILYLTPDEGCIRVMFLLGDRAVMAACASALPSETVEQIRRARRYAEGTAVRLVVRSSEDLEVVRKLVGIKLAS